MHSSVAYSIHQIRHLRISGRYLQPGSSHTVCSPGGYMETLSDAQNDSTARSGCEWPWFRSIAFDLPDRKPKGRGTWLISYSSAFPSTYVHSNQTIARPSWCSLWKSWVDKSWLPFCSRQMRQSQTLVEHMQSLQKRYPRQGRIL
jgi:hypothetical protein